MLERKSYQTAIGLKQQMCKAMLAALWLYLVTESIDFNVNMFTNTILTGKLYAMFPIKHKLKYWKTFTENHKPTSL